MKDTALIAWCSLMAIALLAAGLYDSGPYDAGGHLVVIGGPRPRSRPQSSTTG